MAEWIGQFMQGWPTWLVFLAVIGLLVIMGIITVIWYGVLASDSFTFRRKKHAKK